MQSDGIEGLRVKDIMSYSVTTINGNATLSEALGKMRSEKIHELVVTKDSKMLGILSQDHLLKRMNLPLHTKVENVLSPSPKLSPDNSIISAAEMLISSGLRANPVTSGDNKLVGILSRTDILKIIPKVRSLSDEPVSSIMSRKPVFVTETDSIDKAKELMKSLDEQTLPVVNAKGYLSGMVDIRDIATVALFKTRRQKRELKLKKSKILLEIKSIMRPPVYIKKDANVGTAVQTMLENSLNSIVVIENEKPVGVLTHSDLMELIARRRREETLYVQITGLTESDPFVYDALYTVLQKGIKRIARISKPQMLTVHVSQYKSKGSVSKFSLRARLNTDKKLYFASGVEWDILKAADLLMCELESSVRKDKERAVSSKKKPHIMAKLARFVE